MAGLKDKKYFSNKITERFIQAMDQIIGTRDGVKVTAQSFGEIVGMSGPNLTRLRVSNGEHAVTLEAIGRLCYHYKISADWLINGNGEMYNEGNKKSVSKRLADLENSVSTLRKKVFT